MLTKKKDIYIHTYIWLKHFFVVAKSGKHICKVSILSNYVAKLGKACGSSIMANKSLQYVPKLCMSSITAYSPSPILVLLLLSAEETFVEYNFISP